MDKLATLAVHAGDTRLLGGAVDPIVRSTANHTPPGTPYDQIQYPRLSCMPNSVAAGAKVAALEGCQDGLVTSTGMAAITSALLTVLQPGDHLLVQRVTYGASHVFTQETLPDWGVGVTAIDGSDPASWADAILPNTRAIYVETISNPLMRVTDLEAVVALARQHGLVSIADHTFASPVLVPGGPLGLDLVVHSATKYLNGHSDVCAGAVAGTTDRVAAVRRTVQLYGGSLDAEAAWLLSRGMKTLPMRVDAQCRGALQVAHALAGWGLDVHYPGLPSHPDHAVAKRLFEDRFGGMLAVDLGSADRADAMLDRLRVFFAAPSLGGVESLATRPAATSHAKLTAAQRADAGIGEGLVRLSVGIEDPGDLIADLKQAIG